METEVIKALLIILLAVGLKCSILLGQSLRVIDNTYNSFVHQTPSDLWISSQGGWNRYDGMRTHHYLANDSVSGLKGEWIQSGFYPDNQGRLWNSTYDHLCFFEKNDDRFYCFQPSLGDSIIAQGFSMLGLEQNTQYPIIKANNELCYYHPDSNTLRPFSGESKTLVSIHRLLTEPDTCVVGIGHILNGLVELWSKHNDEVNWTCSTYDLGACSSFSGLYVTDVVRVKDRFYFSSSQGLLILNPNNPCNSQLLTFKGEPFKGYEILHKEACLFLSTDKFGLLIYDTINKKWIEEINTDHRAIPLSSNNPIELHDIGDELMLSYRNVDPQFISWNPLLALLKLNNDISLDVMPERIYFKGAYQVISQEGGEVIIYKNNAFFADFSIKTVGLLRNFNIHNDILCFHDESSCWSYNLNSKTLDLVYKHSANSLQEVFHYRQEKFAIIENKVFQIIDKKLNKILPPDLNEGVISFYQLTDTTSLLFRYNEAFYITSRDTLAFSTSSYNYDCHFDTHSGLIYMGLGTGLGIYDINNHSFETISIAEARVNEIMASDDSDLTLATSKGIYKFNQGKVERIPTSIANVKHLYKKDNSLYYMSDGKLTLCDYKQSDDSKSFSFLLKKSNHSPKRAARDDLGFEYSYKASPLRLTLLTDAYKANEMANYSYEIIDYNYAISNQSFDQDVHLPPLPSGSYKIVVTGRDHLYRDINPLQIELKILGPIYTRWWFILGAFLTLVLFIWSYLRFKTKKLKKEIAVVEEMNELEKAALQAQMNPHFIFNCLNSIQNFIMDNDKESAMEYLGRFAKLIRLNLRASAETKISLQDEISILENYLSLEQLRLSDRFNFSINLNNIQNTENIMLPPMLIQPFVENAVIHGMKHKEGGGQISVVFTRSDEYLQVSIKDNGELYDNAVASKPDTKKSYGVSITKKRLAHNNLRNNSNYKIENTLAGTTVNIEIKL